MTSEIKYSWLTANDAKPNRINHVRKYYSLRQSKIYKIFSIAKTFGIVFSDEDVKKILARYYFYNEQWHKLYDYHQYLKNRKLGEQWKRYNEFFIDIDKKMEKNINRGLSYYQKYNDIY